MSYTPQTPEEEKRMAAGKAGKLWSIVVEYTVRQNNETKFWRKVNMTGEEVLEFRMKVFQIGLLDVISPGYWVVVPPLQLREIIIQKQDNFFEP